MTEYNEYITAMEHNRRLYSQKSDQLDRALEAIERVRKIIKDLEPHKHAAFYGEQIINSLNDALDGEK